MPVRHSAIHKIDKKPDGSQAVLHLASAEQVESQARDELINQFNESYNAKTGKAWGFFHAESGAFPLSGWLGKYLAGVTDFLAFSTTAVEHLTMLMEESNLSVGGHVLFAHYQQGMTDYLAIARLLAENALDPQTTVLLRGSGGMAKAVAAAMHDAGFAHVTIVARNEARGRALAALYGFSWLAEVSDASDAGAGMLINVTPLGMAGADEAVQSFSDSLVSAAEVVFDVVALPSETPLIQAARAAGKRIITGAEVIAIQAEEQFVLYTGVRPSPELVREASEFSRR